MMHLWLFFSAFLTVFLLGFQQKNVQGNHYISAIFTSFGIGGAQIFLWRLVPDANATQIIATLAGGPFGIVAAMWVHPRLAKLRGKPKANRSPIE